MKVHQCARRKGRGAWSAEPGPVWRRVGSPPTSSLFGNRFPNKLSGITAITDIELVMLAWLALSNVVTFFLFGHDKRLATKRGHRVPEYQLTLWAALGGWPGGLLAMVLFRHKTAKLLFLLKYSVAFLIWFGLVYGYWQSRH